MASLPNQLVQLSDIKSIVKNISSNIDEQRINTAIMEAQNIDVKPLINEQVYITLIEGDVIPDNYLQLMNGCIYTYNDLKYKFEGLKVAIIYFAYARLIKGLDSSVSAGGLVQKNNDFSTHTPIRERMNAANEAESIGNLHLKECLDYLTRNNDLFPEFRNYLLKKKSTFRVLGD